MEKHVYVYVLFFLNFNFNFVLIQSQINIRTDFYKNLLNLKIVRVLCLQIMLHRLLIEPDYHVN